MGQGERPAEADADADQRGGQRQDGGTQGAEREDEHQRGEGDAQSFGTAERSGVRFQ